MIYENTPSIETERLILRKFTEKDITSVFEIFSEEETNTFLPWFPLKSVAEAEKFLQNRFLEYDKKPSAYRYALCLKNDNLPIGYVWLSENDSHDFGYGLKKQFWHKGIITEGAKAVVEKIKNAGYRYITATHDVKNPRSGNVMKQLGMAYRYSYVEQWQPKNITVTFRMYQLNFERNDNQLYLEYWNNYPSHFTESC